MKYGLIFLLFFVSCSQSYKVDYQFEVNTYKDGIRVYDDEGEYLGQSPVVVHKTLRAKSLGQGLWRYFIDDQEVHPGQKYFLKVYIFSNGVKKQVISSILFDPDQHYHKVKVIP